MRKPLTLAVALATSFVFGTASASALEVSALKVTATNANVRYHYRICEAVPADVHVYYQFHALDRPSGTFTGDDYDHERKGCSTWSGSFPNRYNTGLWQLKLTVSDSHGSLKRISGRVYVP